MFQLCRNSNCWKSRNFKIKPQLYSATFIWGPQFMQHILVWLQKSPASYKHTDLPNGKDLHGEPLKNALINIFSEYTTDIVVRKLSPCANSQRNESLNSTI